MQFTILFPSFNPLTTMGHLCPNVETNFFSIFFDIYEWFFT